MFNHNRGLWGYTGAASDGLPLTIQSTGMGGPSAAIVIAELADLGARRLLRVGTCGALDPRARARRPAGRDRGDPVRRDEPRAGAPTAGSRPTRELARGVTRGAAASAFTTGAGGLDRPLLRRPRRRAARVDRAGRGGCRDGDRDAVRARAPAPAPGRLPAARLRPRWSRTRARIAVEELREGEQRLGAVAAPRSDRAGRQCVGDSDRSASAASIRSSAASIASSRCASGRLVEARDPLLDAVEHVLDAFQPLRDRTQPPASAARGRWPRAG